MSLLVANRLSKAFGAHQAVADLSFAIEAGEMVAMIGANGAGKSTCFNLLGGQMRPDAGSLRFKGVEIAGWTARRIWRLGVGRTFQVAATFGSMTVVENVQLALLSARRRLWRPWARAARLEKRAALALLADVGMAGQAERPCAQLAYGDLKRVELALGLAHDPALLLLDEPTAGMAPAERGALMALVADLAARRGTTVLFTEHDMDVVFGHAGRLLVLDRGRLIADGPPGVVREDPRVRRSYLGGGL